MSQRNGVYLNMRVTRIVRKQQAGHAVISLAWQAKPLNWNLSALPFEGNLYLFQVSRLIH